MQKLEFKRNIKDGMPKPPEQTDHSTMDEEEEEGDEEEEEEDSPLKLRKFLEESGKIIVGILFK